jgi:hypothetical protein
MTQPEDKKPPVSAHSPALPSADEKGLSKFDTPNKINHNTNIEVTTPLAGSPSHVPRGDSFCFQASSMQEASL